MGYSPDSLKAKQKHMRARYCGPSRPAHTGPPSCDAQSSPGHATIPPTAGYEQNDAYAQAQQTSHQLSESSTMRAESWPCQRKPAKPSNARQSARNYQLSDYSPVMFGPPSRRLSNPQMGASHDDYYRNKYDSSDPAKNKYDSNTEFSRMSLDYHRKSEAAAAQSRHIRQMIRSRADAESVYSELGELLDLISQHRDARKAMQNRYVAYEDKVKYKGHKEAIANAIRQYQNTVGHRDNVLRGARARELGGKDGRGSKKERQADYEHETQE